MPDQIKRALGIPTDPAQQQQQQQQPPAGAPPAGVP
jgi:hypothetical protein